MSYLNHPTRKMHYPEWANIYLIHRWIAMIILLFHSEYSAQEVGRKRFMVC